jgi:RNA polymerase sigma factor (sigma-70 family)
VTKEQLKAYRAIKLERDKLADMLAELEATMYGPKSQKLDGMPRSGSGVGSPTESIALKHADLRARYEQKVAELTAALSEIETAIETLAPRERTLIRLHYAEGLTWEQVCVEMSYSWMQIHRIHGKALEALKNTKASE